MTFKKNTDRMMVTHVAEIDLDNLYVTKTLEGKKTPSRVSMTVKDLIEHLTAFGLDGIVESECFSGGNCLLIKTIRKETDEEYDARMDLLKILDHRSKEARKKKNQEKRQEELQLLKKLMNKYKVKEKYEL